MEQTGGFSNPQKYDTMFREVNMIVYKIETAVTLLGSKHSDKTKQKQSIAKIGKPTWNTETKGTMKSNSGSFGNGRVAPLTGCRKAIIDGRIRYVKENHNDL